MKVKCLTISAGPTPEDCWLPGDMRDLPNEVAIALVEQGLAVPIKGPEVEVAVIQPAETAKRRKK